MATGFPQSYVNGLSPVAPYGEQVALDHHGCGLNIGPVVLTGVAPSGWPFPANPHS